MKRYCLALDLQKDPALIAQYEEWHKKVWPEVLDSLRASGIAQMQIYRTGNRLCMILETSDDFTFERKKEMDLANAKVQEWEELMSNFQRSLPWGLPDEKWVLMEPIFHFKA